MVRRNKYLKKGGQIKMFPIRGRQHKALGGIPMKLNKNKQIVYAQIVPNSYSYCPEREDYIDAESIEREYATLPEGEGSFIRRHIYEMRFGILDETDKERRKREYEEWWDEQPKGL